jgi:hypothetical protein
VFNSIRINTSLFSTDSGFLNIVCVLFHLLAWSAIFICAISYQTYHILGVCEEERRDQIWE